MQKGETEWKAQARMAIRRARVAACVSTASAAREAAKAYARHRWEVHGETGFVQSAPVPLADHLGLRAHEDVKQCMDWLARKRAEACLEALVQRYDVPRSQL